MKGKILLLLLSLLPLLSFGQGCITIFSEDGDRFYLVLNGIKQNSVPQTNVRVDGLGNEYYSAKIIFEDATKQPISKNMPVKDVETNQFAEMTYKLKTAKDGQIKLRYFSATPVPDNYVAPPDMYVTHYVTTAPPAGTVTQTTQTTTVTNGNTNGVNLNVGAGGLNMSVNVNDPDAGGNVNMNMNFGADPSNTRVTQHTTTTTTTHHSTINTQSAPPPPPSRGCAYPMGAADFNSAKSTISGTSFEETKLSTAKSILSGNCLSTDQVVQICKLFNFEESKLDFAKAAYSRTTDPNNYFKVSNVFNFDASKTDLNDFISGH